MLLALAPVIGATSGLHPLAAQQAFDGSSHSLAGAAVDASGAALGCDELVASAWGSGLLLRILVPTPAVAVAVGVAA